MLVAVGRVGRPHGVRGEVAVEIRTDEPELRYLRGAVLSRQPDADALVVEGARMHSGRMLVKFVGIDDRTRAEQLRGDTLYADVDPSQSPSDADEFYDHELIGLAVVDRQRGVIGQVRQVVHGPGQELLEVSDVDDPTGAGVLIPFVAALVPTVDVAGGRITVDLPDGLLDLADGAP